jgi:hypothetical protein
MLTLFTWGYWGWGNATHELIRAVDATERQRGFKPPIFFDFLRNVTTTPPDRVREFSFKASGGSYAKLFDGSEKVLSWDNILWINRSVLLP